VSTVDKKLVHMLITLTIPALIDYALQSAVMYADYIMVGKLGSNASATIGLTVEVNFLLKGAMMAVGIGMVSYISISMGQKLYDNVRKASIQAFFLAGMVGIILFIIAMIISPFLPVWLGAEEALRPDASAYFRIIYIPVVFNALNIILGSVLKGVGDMKTPMYVNVIMNILNIAINFFLIYDSRPITVGGLHLNLWGAGFGVKGAAIGTALASVIGGILMVIGVYRNSWVSPRGEKFRLDKAIIRRCITIALPVFLCRVTTSFGRVVFTAFVTGLGTITFAAHTIAFTIESAFYMPVVGAQTAVITLAGNSKGEGNKKKLNQLTIYSCAITAGIMFAVGILMILVAKPAMSIFTSDPTVIHIGARLLFIVAINEPIFGISIIMEGIFNGTGDTRSPFLISTATLWIVRVFGTWIAVYVLGTGIYGAWICMILENATRSIALMIRYYLKRDRFIISERIELKAQETSV